jgi:hypothetical protein
MIAPELYLATDVTGRNEMLVLTWAGFLPICDKSTKKIKKKSQMARDFEKVLVS